MTCCRRSLTTGEGVVAAENLAGDEELVACEEFAKGDDTSYCRIQC